MVMGTVGEDEDGMVVIPAVIVEIWVTVIFAGGADVVAGAETQTRPGIALSDSPATRQYLFGLISHKMLTQGGGRTEDPPGPQSPWGPGPGHCAPPTVLIPSCGGGSGPSGEPVGHPCAPDSSSSSHSQTMPPGISV